MTNVSSGRPEADSPSKSPGGRTCTCTGRGLNSLPLHWATPGKCGEGRRRLVGMRHPDAAGSTSGKIVGNGGPGRIRTVNLPIQSRMLYLIELRG